MAGTEASVEASPQTMGSAAGAVRELMMSHWQSEDAAVAVERALAWLSHCVPLW